MYTSEPLRLITSQQLIRPIRPAFDKRLRRAVVVAGDEGHLGRDRLALPSARLHLQLRARLGVGLEHVPHGDVLLEHGRESATGDLANLGAVGCEDLGPGSRGRAFANLEADASLGDGRGCLELRLDDVAADEIALLAAGLADGPGQAGFDGADVLVEVVAVENRVSGRAVDADCENNPV